MTTDFQEFMALTDENIQNALGITRDRDNDTQREGSIALVCSTEQDMESGAVLVAIGTVGHDVDSVEIALHGFIDGERVMLSPMLLGDEVVISLRPRNA